MAALLSAKAGELYAFPREKSIRHFMDQVRALTKRRVPLKTQELIAELNPALRGWGHYYKKAHVRKLFHRLDGWIVRRIRSHRFKHWRNGGWRQLPETKLYGEYGLVNLVRLILLLHSGSVSLRESCIRENRTCSLSGGRWRERKRATSDPTLRKACNTTRWKGGGLALIELQWR